jgi:hypothetical protein
MSTIDMDQLTRMTALHDIGKTVKDMETIGSIMVEIGLHVPTANVAPSWMVFFGLAIEEISANLAAADAVLNP